MLSRAEDAGIDLDADAAKRVLAHVKEREHRGYHYETANASFELLLRREAGAYHPLFRLEGYRVIVEKNETGIVDTQATIKIWVDGNRYLHTAEGRGPVNALDKALRLALEAHHPHLPQIELTNFKVRLIEGAHGTDAITRVLLDSTDREDQWGSIGVSENIIEASWEALVDSLEYAFQPEGRPPRNIATSSASPAGVRGSDTDELDAPRRFRSRGPRSGSVRRSSCSRCCAPAGSRWARCRRTSSAPSPTTWGSRMRSPSRRAPPRFTSGSGRWSWGEGDEVVTSPFSFVASANCLLYEGATPIFCDVDPITLNLDPEAAATAIGERTVGLLPVDILGYPAALPRVRAPRRRRWAGPARGRLRGARRPRLRGAIGRHARLARDLRLLCQQAADDR